MKKLLISLLLALLTTSLSFAARNEDMVIILKAKDNSTKIHTTFVVGNTIIGKENSRNYHVTVAWLKDVRDKNKKPISKLAGDLINEINKVKVNPVPIVFGEGYILQVSPTCPLPGKTSKLNTKCNRNAITIDPNNKDAFKIINAQYNTVLDNFNSSHGTHFEMYLDITPPYFTPHITLADTNNKLTTKQRETAIQEVTNKIKQQNEIKNGFTSVLLSK